MLLNFSFETPNDKTGKEKVGLEFIADR